jgi:WD40 repeat protein
MLKKSKIEELPNDKVITLFDQALSKYGFKLLKSKQQFIRQENDFNQIININTRDSQLVYDDNTGQLHLVFNIFSQIDSPNYENWYLEKFGEKVHFSLLFDTFTSQIELSFDDFEKENFYELTASQKFKRNVTHSLMSRNSAHKDIIFINELLETNIPLLVSKLQEHSDILHIHKQREYPFQYIYLLIFGGYDEMAKTECQKYYDHFINEIETRIKISETEASGYIEALDKFIKNIQKVSTLSFTNPYKAYKRSVKIFESKSDSFEFSQKTKFSEVLRLDISQFEVKSLNINPIGDILLFTDNKKILKLNSKGELVFEKDIETKKGFDRIIWGVPSGVIKGTNDFFINNYIITSENELLELPLPIQKLKKGKLQNPHIADLAFWDKEDVYVVIYEDNFLVFSKNGALEKTINIAQKYHSRIIIEKEWIVTQNKEAANSILKFNGEPVGTYEYGNGNNYYEFSPNYQYLICFFYSTKSQFYDLTNGKKGTLWAHPTFIKDYKEKMYDDINHNFGMTIAKFSPDNKYIVGGADHGKYVAWTLPKLDRIELIPQIEMIEQLEPYVWTRRSNGKSEDIVTKAELVVLENQTFLKNRSNEISKIIFFENGDTFITELGSGKFVLSWSRNFDNLTYKKIGGILDFHSDKYLTQRSKTEIIIYEPK